MTYSIAALKVVMSVSASMLIIGTLLSIRFKTGRYAWFGVTRVPVREALSPVIGNILLVSGAVMALATFIFWLIGWLTAG